jgi:restriction system protein
MPIPDFQTVMLPLLKVTSDGKEHRLLDALNALAEKFRLDEAERKDVLPSGVGRILTIGGS